LARILISIEGGWVESVLGGRRLEYPEVAQANYGTGFRRENLATIIAICDWESARFEEARLIYDDGSSDDGVLQINSSVWQGDRTDEEWHEIVWHSNPNFEIGRQIYTGRKERLGAAKKGFEAWVAFSNGNFKRSIQVGRHWTAQVDSTFYPVNSFKWWGIRWISGDGKIFEAMWKKIVGDSANARNRLERWKITHPKQAAILWTPTKDAQPDRREVEGVRTPMQADVYKAMMGEDGGNYNVSPTDTKKALNV
jgi:C-type lysozyme/alpha-lactalbumin family